MHGLHASKMSKRYLHAHDHVHDTHEPMTQMSRVTHWIRTYRELVRKELPVFTHTWTTFLVLVAFVLVAGWMFWSRVFQVGQVTLVPLFSVLPWLWLVLVAAVSMRVWSTEFQSRTMERLQTRGVTSGQIVAAKYTVAWAMVMGVCVGCIPIAIALVQLGSPDWGQIGAGVVGLILLSGFMVAVGAWVSVHIRASMVSFVVTASILFVWLAVGTTPALSSVGPVAEVLARISPLVSFRAFVDGFVDVANLLYFVLATCFFLFATRWRLLIGPYRWRQQERWARAFRPWLACAVTISTIAVLSFIPWQADWTKGDRSSLDRVSVQAAQALTDPAQIRLYFSRDVPPAIAQRFSAIERMAQQYARASEYVQVERVDPRDSDALLEQVKDAAIPEIQLNVVNDTGVDITQGYAGATISVRGETQVIPVVSDPAAFEYIVTSALQRFTTSDPQPVHVITGEQVVSHTVLRDLIAQHYAVQSVTFDQLPSLHEVFNDRGDRLEEIDLEQIPSVLVVPGLRDVDAARARAVIALVLARGGTVIALQDGFEVNEATLENASRPEHVRRLLEPFGVVIAANIVADFASAQPLSVSQGAQAAYPLWPRFSRASFDKDSLIAQGVSSTVFPWPSEVLIESVPSGSVVREVMRTSAASAAYTAAPVALDPAQIVAPAVQQSQLMAVQMERVPVYNERGDGELQLGQTRGSLLVFGSSRFVNDALLANNPGNAALVLNAIDVAHAQEDVLQLRAASAVEFPFDPLNPADRRAARYGSLAGAVVLLGGIGLLFTWRRRRYRAWLRTSFE